MGAEVVPREEGREGERRRARDKKKNEEGRCEKGKKAGSQREEKRAERG